jgi:hypothetical protein
MRLFIEGVGVIGPGLEGWPATRLVLVGAARYQPIPIRPSPIALLPPAERRRAGTTARLAVAAGTEALAQAGREPADMPMVFAASGGDGETVHETLTVLATPRREVSPTRFHNSVHNAPSGYWSVATGSRAPSTSLSAFDDSFAAGMLEAAVQASVGDCPVTLIAYDVPYPDPLRAVRPIVAAFSMALVLSPRGTERALASVSLTLDAAGTSAGALAAASAGATRGPSLGATAGATPGALAVGVSPAATMPHPELERLRLGNPAARALPLLAALARGDAGMIRVSGLSIAVGPP